MNVYLFSLFESMLKTNGNKIVLLEKKVLLYIYYLQFTSLNTPEMNTVLQMSVISHWPFYYNKSIVYLCEYLRSQMYYLDLWYDCEHTNREKHRCE